MQIVIDIDDKTYKMIKDSTFFISGRRGSARIMEYNALKAIYDGTPLPKGHGRLGDLDAVLDELERCHITSGVKNQGTWNECVDSIMRTIGSMPSVQPESEDSKFLEFLMNTINPNEMEQYLTMYRSKEVKINGNEHADR